VPGGKPAGKAAKGPKQTYIVRFWIVMLRCVSAVKGQIGRLRRFLMELVTHVGGGVDGRARSCNQLEFSLIFSLTCLTRAKYVKPSGFFPKLSQYGSQGTQDLGQKSFGAKVCDVCKFMYNAGAPGDESLHRTHHDRAQNGVRFKVSQGALHALGLKACVRMPLGVFVCV
jgi:hypothetical protein